MPDAAAAPHIVLFGLMGSGKSTVGERLASRLGRRLVDNDEVLAARVGTTAREYQERHGREALHVEELAALGDALARPEPAVIGAAASVVEAADVDAVLGDRGLAVWLDVPADVLAARVAGDDGHRPLDADVRRQLEEQAAKRGPRFARIADAVVDGERAVDDVVDEILAALDLA